jgi:sulfatase modifying factor 1
VIFTPTGVKLSSVLQRILGFFAIAMWVCGQQPTASPGRRVALVIGNSKYEHLAVLTQPPNEARLMEQTLRACDFTVTPLTDVHDSDFMTDGKVGSFVAGVQPGDTVVVYYSGYAVSGEDDNFLLPVDFNPQGAGELQARSRRIHRLLSEIAERKPLVVVLVLEASRAIDAFVNGQVGRGLMVQPGLNGNVLYASAAFPGETVHVTNDSYSLFTESVATEMKQPGHRLLEVFDNAKNHVIGVRPGQRPEIVDRTSSEFFFTYPELSASPDPLRFTSPAPDNTPDAQSLYVLAGGYARRFRVATPLDSPWLKAISSGTSPASTTPEANVTVSVSPAGLAPGNYESTITISAMDSDLTKSPQLVKVSYTIGKPAESGHKPGDIQINHTDSQEYVWVPEGHFMMGCTAGDKDCKQDENPAHLVTISKAFWIGAKEVSVNDYFSYQKLKTKGMPPPPPQNRHWNRGDFPIADVTWQDAVDFCKWAAPGSRLPTEAEWEYAARAGTETRYWWGSDVGQRSQAKYQHPFLGGKTAEDQYENYAPVQSFKANPWNLYNVAGNVAEWCADWYQKNYDPGPATDPPGPQTGTEKVVRGGSFSDKATAIRSSSRNRLAPEKYRDNVGFRCVIDNWPI